MRNRQALLAYGCALCAWTAVVQGADRQVQSFEPTPEQIAESGAGANPAGTALLEYDVVLDQTVVDLNVTEFTPNQAYHLRLTDGVAEVLLPDALTTDGSGGGGVQQVFAGDLSFWTVELAVDAAGSGTVWSQVPDPAYPPSPGENTSIDITERAVDNILFPFAQQISGLRWWGGWCNAEPPTEEFRVRFYEGLSAGSGSGATVVYEQVVVPAARTATGETLACGVDQYVFEADLPVPFEAAAGVEYWIEIVGVYVSGVNNVFNVSNANSDSGVALPDGDGASLQWSSGFDVWLSGFPDRAFELVTSTSTTGLRATGLHVLTVPGDAAFECDQSIDPGAAGQATVPAACSAGATVDYSDATTAGACDGEATVTRTWTVTGACGQTAAADQLLVLSDTQAPLVNDPVGMSFECPLDVPAADPSAIVAVDSCSETTVTLLDEMTDAGSGCAGDPLTITRTYQAADACDNTASVAQVITVADETGPTIACPPDAIALECPADTSVGTLGSATASDNCGAAVGLDHADASLAGCGTTETITRTWTATDACGNTADCDQTISTVDTAPPVLTVDTSPLAVTDVDCSGDEAVALPTASASDACQGAIPVGNDAPAAFPAGETTTVTFTAADDCGNAASNQLEVTVDHGAWIRVKARKFTIGWGWWPIVTRSALSGVTVAAFDLSPGSCAWQQFENNWWFLHWALPPIFSECTPVATGVTDAGGFTTLAVPPGTYLVAAHVDSNGDGTNDFYLGQFTDVSCGETEMERLFMIQVANGKRMRCRWHRFTGSELIVVEPDEVVWDDEEQLYPFVFEAEGDWDVTVSVTPPEGFISDVDELSEDVDDEVEAVQFTVTEVGSDLVPTLTDFVIQHNGRTHRLRSDIGIKLTAKYARQRGFNVRQLRARGMIVKPDIKPAADSFQEAPAQTVPLHPLQGRSD